MQGNAASLSTAGSPPWAPSRIAWDEALFWLLLGVHALLPGRAQPPVMVLGNPAMPYDLALIAAALVLAASRGAALRLYPRPLLLTGAWFALALLWGLLSLPLWAGVRDGADLAGRLLPLLAAGAAALAAYTLIAGRPAAELRGVLDRACLFLAAIGFAYAAKSLLAPGLELTFVRDAEQRARGPLFGPAVGHLVLLPALGHAAGLALAGERPRWLWAAAAGALLLTVLALGSRGALLGLAVAVALAALAVQGARRRAAIAAGVALAAVLALAVWQLAPQQRLAETHDPFRERTYASAVAAFAEAPGAMLRGQGAGAVWPWYAEDAERSLLDGTAANSAVWRPSPWGDTLLHPHSLPLYLMVELGLPGALAAAGLAVGIAAAWLGSRAGAPWRAAAAAGLGGSVTAMAFDLPLAKSFTLSALWWLWLFGLLAIRDAETAPAGRA